MTATPTNDFLATLDETLALGHDATLAMLAGAPLDGGILIPTLSAAALLATHTDLATNPRVQGPLVALDTERGRKVLDAALPASAVEAMPELTQAMAYEDKTELLREAVELGALTTYANPDLRAALSSHLDRLEVHMLAHGDAHADLGAVAQLLGNVAAFPEAHPVSTLLTMVRASEFVSDFIPVPANAVDLVRAAIAKLVREASAPPETLFAKWKAAVKGLLTALGRDIEALVAMPDPTPGLAYASGPDDIDEHRFTLTHTENDEVNVIFRGERVLLEWQGAGEVPSEARLEATTVLSETDFRGVTDGDPRVRWVLAVPPGDGGTVVTIRFPSGRAQTLTIPAI